MASLVAFSESYETKGAERTAQEVILRYQSGQEIKKGDRVLFHLKPAEIELVVSNPDDPETAWYFNEYGGGVMVRNSKDPNPTFISTDQIPEYEDLEFVERAESK
ncbi:MAG: hypothetical protein WB421_03355 [Terriglobales bacterium]